MTPRRTIASRPARLAGLAGLAAVALTVSCAASGTTPGSATSGGPPADATSQSVTATASASPTADPCLAGSGATTLVGQGPGGALPAWALGGGPHTVVLSDQSDRDLCSWLPFARRLTAHGYRVVLWDYAGAPPADELTAVVAAVRASGGERVVLLGASKGAKSSIVAAAGLGTQVAGVVSLSAEQTLLPRIPVVNYVPRLRCPLLLLTSANDPYGSADAATAFRAVARPGTFRVVVMPGAAHGVDLLSGPTAPAALAAVDTFLGHVSWS